MKALVFHGPGKRSWEDKPKPILENPTDAVVRITHTTICGTDLHILKGDVPAVEAGRILGHEGLGVVEQVGSGLSNIKVGDKVLISCVTSCGRCDYCKRGVYAHCRDGGWILGHLIDGTQAEYVRIPHADNSLYVLPDDMDRAAAVMLSDILPTGHEIGALNGEVKLGDTVAIVGAGPIGLAALMTSRFYSPARIIMIDPDENRLAMAKMLGATDTIARDPIEAIKKLTNDEGVDVAMEAVGIPETFDICQSIVRAGGHIANIGVHGKSVEFKLQDLWIKNITLRTGLVNTDTIPVLMKVVESGGVKPEDLVTHRFKLGEIEKAYDIFSEAAKEKAIKMLLTAE
ncbi:MULTISPECIES: zinc-dependent alcohol dehydrogenase family protein [Marinobacter]|uniref:Zinc-dependent alcohol dehydrogenase family protein n=3 Tax=Marinobacter TaxID=2742 RepID=A0A558BFJ7_9GAMM|nr:MULTISPECIES: zinc-dependent alcohol dehydrogenase family protein [Marinobacter]ABM18311.1 Alcohol dehydrogenase GroES domain protein [Marinobacter nauticus VT8]TVT35271.1 MAG: zinc-dependent alcohol dehydrogenase family protein [Marinobacter vinifirmus]